MISHKRILSWGVLWQVLIWRKYSFIVNIQEKLGAEISVRKLTIAQARMINVFAKEQKHWQCGWC